MKRAYQFVRKPIPCRLNLFPTIPGTDRMDVERYDHISKHICYAICKWTCPSTPIWIEGYAYNVPPERSGHEAKLHELGGVIKHRLFSQGWCNLQSIPPTKWKKDGNGSGTTTKLQSVEFLKTYEPCVDLLKELDLKVSSSGEPPNPAQDIADACGIVWSQGLESNCVGLDLSLSNPGLAIYDVEAGFKLFAFCSRVREEKWIDNERLLNRLQTAVSVPLPQPKKKKSYASKNLCEEVA